MAIMASGSFSRDPRPAHGRAEAFALGRHDAAIWVVDFVAGAIGVVVLTGGGKLTFMLNPPCR
jgi:hypothetical protein